MTKYKNTERKGQGFMRSIHLARAYVDEFLFEGRKAGRKCHAHVSWQGLCTDGKYQSRTSLLVLVHQGPHGILCIINKLMKAQWILRKTNKVWAIEEEVRSSPQACGPRAGQPHGGDSLDPPWPQAAPGLPLALCAPPFVGGWPRQHCCCTISWNSPGKSTRSVQPCLGPSRIGIAT